MVLETTLASLLLVLGTRRFLCPLHYLIPFSQDPQYLVYVNRKKVFSSVVYLAKEIFAKLIVFLHLFEGFVCWSTWIL